MPALLYYAKGLSAERECYHLGVGPGRRSFTSPREDFETSNVDPRMYIGRQSMVAVELVPENRIPHMLNDGFVS